MSTARETLQHLDTIPIETLGLSEQALQVLKWGGITNVGDCVIFYHDSAMSTNERSTPLFLVMYGEVAPKLKQQGYWFHVVDADMWSMLKNVWIRYASRSHKMIALWQGKEQNLYQIPLKALGLSKQPLDANWRIANNVGEWLQKYYALCQVNPAYREGSLPDSPYYDLQREILRKMQVQPFWPLFEEQFDFD